ncbi:MAG: hypothetical protein GY913_29125 [Proteobacteria bacterium]|nr:hypothetical protein [Pseudomonadota bacterium]MCP4920977.1 hypothetical protein [Pseudomonadota bacterium]
MLGIGTLPSAAEAGPIGDVIAWLRHLDRDQDVVRQARPAQRFVEVVRSEGFELGHLQEMLAALLVLDRLSDAPPDVVADPRIRARIDDEAMTVGAAALRVADWLDRMPVERRRRLGEELRRPLTVLEGLEQEFLGLRPGRRSPRRAALKRNLGGLAQLFSQHDAATVVDELVSSVAVVAQDAGLERADWVLVSETDPTAAAAAKARDDRTWEDEQLLAARQRKRSLILIGISLSGWATLLGGGAVLSETTSDYGLFFLGLFYSCTVGPILLFIGIGFLISARKHTVRAQELYYGETGPGSGG